VSGDAEADPGEAPGCAGGEGGGGGEEVGTRDPLGAPALPGETKADRSPAPGTSVGIADSSAGASAGPGDRAAAVDFPARSRARAPGDSDGRPDCGPP